MATTVGGRPKTKIICTLGPSTDSDECIGALMDRGMSVARLNLSHGSLDDHTTAIGRIRGMSARKGVPVGIMVDLPGAKYRTGPVESGSAEVSRGDVVTLTSREVAGSARCIGVRPPGIHRDATAGCPVLVDDGLIELKTLEVRGEDVHCQVIAGGTLTELRGVTVPGKTPSLAFPDEQTLRAIDFAAESEVDFVAVSTVTQADDVNIVRGLLNEKGVSPPIISKIERAAALENFSDILDCSDGIMVARGDMGVDVPLAKVPVIQKRLIALCNIAGKPVITATQMMDSMIRSPVPTRAEVTDVANAIFDGTDAVMLSGETSVGRYPVEATEMMAKVAHEAEAGLPYETMLVEKRPRHERKTDDAIAYDAVRTAHQLNAALIVAFTESGGTAGRVSKYRPEAPILALVSNELVQRSLTLRWGVTPVPVEGLQTVEDFFESGEEQAVKVAGLTKGALVVLVAGVPIGVPGGTNLLRVLTISGSR